jgi:excisionase family DNA binding protein
MENLVFTQLSIPEVRELFRRELELFFESNKIATATPQLPQLDQFLTVKETATFLRLSVPTIYALIQKAQIPCMKRSKRVYFSKSDLIAYLKHGTKKTRVEIEAETDEFLSLSKKKNRRLTS